MMGRVSWGVGYTELGRFASRLLRKPASRERDGPDESPMLAQRAPSEGTARGREELSLLPERAPEKGLARRPQSKAPHALAWLGIVMTRRRRLGARSGGLIVAIPGQRQRASLEELL